MSTNWNEVAAQMKRNVLGHGKNLENKEIAEESKAIQYIGSRLMNRDQLLSASVLFGRLSAAVLIQDDHTEVCERLKGSDFIMKLRSQYPGFSFQHKELGWRSCIVSAHVSIP